MNVLFSKSVPLIECFVLKFNPLRRQAFTLTSKASISTFETRKTYKEHIRKSPSNLATPAETITPANTVPSRYKKSNVNLLSKEEIAFKNSSKFEAEDEIYRAWDVDFNDVKDAYKNKSTSEVIRAWLVFRLCNYNFLVSYGLQISHILQKLLGQTLFNKLMKVSFYGHFVAGENQQEVNKTIAKLEKHGVGAILDYAVEEELSEEKAKDLEMSSCTSNSDEKKDNALTRYRAHRAFGDRRHKVVSARTYFYEGEAKCDENLKIFHQCIEAAGKATETGFAAVKLTALGRPQFLLQFSEFLVKSRRLFEQFSGRKETDCILDAKFDLMRFEKKAKRLGMLMSRDESHHWFTFLDKDESGFVDLLAWNELIATNRRFSDIFQAINPETGNLEALLPVLSDEEELQMKRMFQRVDSLARKAHELGVRLMIDAEQTYFQPAISRITVEMMRKYNKEQTVIMNTYQCYLKETVDHLLTDLALAQKEDFHFGLKLVRGAYMDHERERAAQLGYEDPIQPTYERTNENYDNTIHLLLRRIFEGDKITLMVASHNEDSIKYTLKKMHEFHLPRERLDQIYFGQLLGMCDYITFPLGHSGRHAFKYVPFGPVQDVLPYLYRRAQENRSVLSAAKKERDMLRREIGRRLSSR